MKTKHYFFIVFTFISIQIHAQSSQRLSQIATCDKSGNWIEFKQNLKLNPLTLLDDYKYPFGLTVNDKMKVIKTETDQLGYVHYRYQQYYHGIPVENKIFIIHSLNNIAVKGNGEIAKGIKINTIPQISSEQAIQKALDYTKAEKYMWESANDEKLLKYSLNNANATFYPIPKLVIIEINKSYKLAWKMDVYAQKPLSRNYIYIDAENGTVLSTINRIQTTDVPGIAVTKYAGTKPIITDSTAPGNYRLREVTHGLGIETYDMNQGTNYGAAVDFIDTDNMWNNVNPAQDEVATDAHFAAEKTYEFYKLKFNRSSFDNADAKLLSYVHYDAAYNNAFWDGTRMTYGDGDGTSYSPFTSLDIGGHEITHAVTEHTANLVYQNESGAMNEGFSDIFGACVEFFGDTVNADWYMGEDIDLTGGNGLRDLSDPKAAQNPDTYLGQYWYVGSLDNGGVHTNSGVLYYWFYLLSVGGSGTNDINNNYNVSGISLDSAMQIAYRTLVYYLTPNSTYVDARNASILAAKDLFGICSDEYIQTANAWYAVGVGSPISNNDMMIMAITQPITACGLTNAEYISAMFKYNGCNISIPAGDTITVSYRADGGSIVNENIILALPLNGGDTLNYTFATTFDASILGTHTIDCWIAYAHDTVSFNDSIVGYTFESKLQQNVDVGVVGFHAPNSGCDLSNAELVNIDVKFFGCDSLPANDSIVVAYRVDGGTPVHDTLILSASLYSDSIVNFTFSVPADLSLPGIHSLDAWTEFDIDNMNTNDYFNNYKVKNPFSVGNDTVGFEELNINNLMMISTTAYSHAFVSSVAHNTGTKGFQMTGGNAMNYIDMIEFPNGTNTWSINEFLSAKVTFCVDASTWSTANMRFDLKQTYGKTAYEMILGAGDYSMASNFRVLVNGTQIGGTYNPPPANNDTYTTHYVNLDAYAGTNFSVTFETRNLSKDTIIYIMDNGYLDNVCFTPLPQSINETNLEVFRNASVFPNPTTGKFVLQLDGYYRENISVDVLDVLGRKTDAMFWSIENGINKKELDFSSYLPGVYFLKLQSKQGIQTLRIVKN